MAAKEDQRPAGKKTWFERRAERIAREQAEAQKLADVIEKQALLDMAPTVGAKLTKAGHGLVGRSSPTAIQEEARVRKLLDRDKAYYEDEIIRKTAELEVAEGKTVNIREAVIGPTPEWIEKGDVRKFTPRLEDGTVVTVTGYRRRRTPLIVGLLNSGKINDDQFAACLWYRGLYEKSGLEGRYKVSNLSGAGGGESGGMGQAPMALCEYEVQARMDFRAAREQLPAAYRRFFDAVVVDDIPLRRAARFARCRDERALALFGDFAETLYAYCESVRERMVD